MKSFVASLLVLAVAAQAQFMPGMGPAFGGFYPAGIVPVPAAPVFGYAPISSQYHSQDEFGQANFGYSFPGQASANYRDPYGNQIGSYSYYNPDGKLVRVSYTSDFRGYRVLSNDLPVAPLDTPEVAQAKAAHLASWNAARLAAVTSAASTPVVVAGAPVAATDMVVAGSDNTVAASENTVAEAAAPVAVSRKKRQVSGLPLPYAASPYGAPFPYAAPLAAPTAVKAAPSVTSAVADPALPVLPPRILYDFPIPTFAAPPLPAPVAVVATPVAVSPVADVPVAIA